MIAFVIADRNSEDLDTPVFRASPSGEDEAVIVFTGSEAAQKYIKHAGWQEDHTVAEVAAADFVAWLVQARENGVRFLVVDPEETAGDELGTQTMLEIEEQLSAAGSNILRLARPDF